MYECCEGTIQLRQMVMIALRQYETFLVHSSMLIYDTIKSLCRLCFYHNLFFFAKLTIKEQKYQYRRASASTGSDMLKLIQYSRYYWYRRKLRN